MRALFSLRAAVYPVRAAGVPHGPTSAHPASLQTYPAGGYVSIVIPFFSSVFLPDEKGPSDQVRKADWADASRSRDP